MRLILNRHPDTPCEAVRVIEVEVTCLQDGTLDLHYTVIGEIAALALPSPTEPLRADELWKHTCLEVFIREEGGGNYLEFNFSPSTQWAAYGFDGYRTNMQNADVPTPHIRSITAPDRFDLKTSVKVPGSTARRLGLSAVIEEVSGTISYWAYAHPPGEPDFHHAASFAYDLPIPDADQS